MQTVSVVRQVALMKFYERYFNTSEKRKKRRAVDDFVNRENHLELFISSLESLFEGKDVPILNFYGRSGIGKSTLLARCLSQNFDSLFPENHDKLIIVSKKTDKGRFPIS